MVDTGCLVSFSQVSHKEDAKFPVGNPSHPYAWPRGLSLIGSTSTARGEP